MWCIHKIIMNWNRVMKKFFLCRCRKLIKIFYFVTVQNLLFEVNFQMRFFFWLEQIFSKIKITELVWVFNFGKIQPQKTFHTLSEPIWMKTSNFKRIFQNLPYGVFWLRCSCHWKWYVFFAPFFAPFFCAISFIKISFFPLNGQINRIVSKKIKQGHNYYPKFSISHFFQNFQHFFTWWTIGRKLSILRVKQIVVQSLNLRVAKN